MELADEELSVIRLALERARENAIEPNGVGSYGGEIAQRVLDKLENAEADEFIDWLYDKES